jgi:hypothetical protein
MAAATRLAAAAQLLREGSLFISPEHRQGARRSGPELPAEWRLAAAARLHCDFEQEADLFDEKPRSGGGIRDIFSEMTLKALK